MLKKTLISLILFTSLLIITTGCQSSQSSVRIVGINIEKYNTKTQKYESQKKTTNKRDIEMVKQITDSVEQNKNDSTTIEVNPDYQFNYLFKTNNADVKTVTYQIKITDKKEEELLLGVDGIYHQLSTKEAINLKNIIIEK